MTLNRRILKRVHSPLKSPKRNNSLLRKKALIKQLSGEVQFGAASKANVKVVVRIRPPNAREIENGERSVLKTVDEHMMIFDPKEEDDDFFFKGVRQRTRDLNKRQHKEQKFMFERIFDIDSTNEQIYEETTKDLVDTILSGYNCSVFAYGATGAGKTFTMLGKPECPGITFLTLMELYRRIDEVKEEKLCEVGVSYLEVYNETVRDLLQPGKLLNVQENGSQILVPGLSLHKPEDADELLQMLALGNQNRTQHPTDANAESSRSHAVFQIYVRQQARTANVKSNVCIAKLSMIDLAGSERGAATGFKGARFREGANINRSLLALGNCINALADGLRHVPYRDSKLTRLLKDSLGGNCRSVMIAAVSPAASSFEDTFNTLRYANRAKTIKTTLKKNLMNVDQHVSQYVKIVEDLREEICSLKEKVKLYEQREAKCESSQAATEKQNEADKIIASLEKQLLEKSALAAKAHYVSEGESLIQRKLEDVSLERKALRRELLQLESSQRELELKIYNCNLRLLRMKIVSSISQKLDKSMSKCERTIRNLLTKLGQMNGLRQNVEMKLNANLAELQSIQAELQQWGPNSSQPSLASKGLLEKHEAAVEERDLLQQTEYLRGLVKEFVTEQSSSEQMICHLLNVVRGFYIQLRTYNNCTPDMEKLFESCLDNMDESKILWADQQRSDECSGQQNTNKSSRPSIDISRLTYLPIMSNTFISPAAPQDNKVFRRSIMKSTSSDNLQCISVNTKLTSVQSYSGISESKNKLSKISESTEKSSVMDDGSSSPVSPVLSSYSTSEVPDTPKPSPVINSGSLPNRIFVPISSSQPLFNSTNSNVHTESSSSSPLCITSSNAQMTRENGIHYADISSMPYSSGVIGGHCITSSPSAERVSAALNVTVNMSSSSQPVAVCQSPVMQSDFASSLSRTKTCNIEDTKNLSEDLNQRVDRLPHIKELNVTMDLSAPKSSKKKKVPTATLR